jgi:hypothetical protein
MTGPYSSEGEDELRSYQPAVKHLNDGGGWVDSQFDDPSGEDVPGYEIDYAEGDTATDPDTATRAADPRWRRRPRSCCLTTGSFESYRGRVSTEVLAEAAERVYGSTSASS